LEILAIFPTFLPQLDIFIVRLGPRFSAGQKEPKADCPAENRMCGNPSCRKFGYFRVLKKMVNTSIAAFTSQLKLVFGNFFAILGLFPRADREENNF